jgi:hypothetical protein
VSRVRGDKRRKLHRLHALDAAAQRTHAASSDDLPRFQGCACDLLEHACLRAHQTRLALSHLVLHPSDFATQTTLERVETSERPKGHSMPRTPRHAAAAMGARHRARSMASTVLSSPAACSGCIERRKLGTFRHASSLPCSDAGMMVWGA